MRLRERALPRRIEHHGVEWLELWLGERPAVEVASFGRNRFQAGGRLGGCPERGDRAGVAIRRRHPGPFRQPQRKRADPAK